MITERLVERLSLYRHLLETLPPGTDRLYSHDLAALAGTTPAQVRRDLMTIGFAGSPSKGYDLACLALRIADWLDAPGGQSVALVGLGNLGRAILAYLEGRRAKLRITAGFDADERKVREGVIHGCRCYPASEITARVRDLRISVGIIAVPAAAAKQVAAQLVEGGVLGIVNFAPTPLVLPPEIYVEHRDITYSLEKAAFFARNPRKPYTPAPAEEGEEAEP